MSEPRRGALLYLNLFPVLINNLIVTFRDPVVALLALLLFVSPSSVEPFRSSASFKVVSGTHALRTGIICPSKRFPKKSSQELPDQKPDDDATSLADLQKALQHYHGEFTKFCEANPLTVADDGEDACARGLSAAERAREMMLTTRIPWLALNRVTVTDENAVAGFGVFAARALAEGELVTCYPADALVHAPSRGVVWGKHVPDALCDAAKCFDDGIHRYRVLKIAWFQWTK